MDNQDQRRTHTPGHENHVCRKCGWHFPNPHPSAKQRRAHKKICGTIQAASDSDDDHHKTPPPGFIVSGSNNGKRSSNDGNGEKLIRTEDEVFSDAAVDFLDRFQQDGLDLGVDAERVNTNEQKISGHEGFNAADVSPLVVESSNESQLANPKILHGENVEVGNVVGLQGQLSGSTVGPLTSSVANLRTGELNIMHGDDSSGLSSVEKELKGKDEVKSENDMVEFVDSSDNILGETFEVVSKIEVSDAVSLDHEVGDGTITPKEKKGPKVLSLLPQGEFPVGFNASELTSEVQVESAHAIQFTTSSDVKVLQEKEEENANIDPLSIHDVGLDATYPQSESLSHEEDNFHFKTSHSSERSDILSPDMHVMDTNVQTETEDMLAEDCTEVFPVKPTFETDQRSHKIGESMNTEMNENHFSEEPGLDDVHSNSQPEGGLMVSSNESQRDASFGFTAKETINIMKNSNKINDLDIDSKDVANVEKDFDFILKNFQPSDFLQGQLKHSSEIGKVEECELTDAHCKQILTETDPSLPKSFKYVIDGCARKSNPTEGMNIGPVSDLNEDEINSNIKLYEEHNTSVTDSHEARDALLLVKAAEDLASKHTANSSISTVHSNQHVSAVEDGGEPGGEVSGMNAEPIQDQNDVNLPRLSSSGIHTSVDSHEVQDAQLLVKAAEDLASKYASHVSINTEPSAQHGAAVEDNSGGEHGGEVSGITDMPVQDQSGNNFVKHSASGVDASVDSGSRCDSLEGNWGSVSVLSMQSDVPAVTDAENLPSTEAGKSTLNIPQAAADIKQSGKSEVLRFPSFMVESSKVVVSPKGAAASEVQNPQQPNSTAPAGWFPTLNQAINESQGRNKNEEIIAKVTNWSTNKEHIPLKSFLGEATYSNKPNSPIMEENSVNQKGSKVPENNNGSGLTTVNSILGPESPATQVIKGEATSEWNSPARYPANIKREKRKLKSRPFWIQLVCCSTIDPQRR